LSQHRKYINESKNAKKSKSLKMRDSTFWRRTDDISTRDSNGMFREKENGEFLSILLGKPRRDHLGVERVPVDSMTHTMQVGGWEGTVPPVDGLANDRWLYGLNIGFKQVIRTAICDAVRFCGVGVLRKIEG
jgi:hypothetical protein